MHDEAGGGEVCRVGGVHLEEHGPRGSRARSGCRCRGAPPDRRCPGRPRCRRRRATLSRDLDRQAAQPGDGEVVRVDPEIGGQAAAAGHAGGAHHVVLGDAQRLLHVGDLQLEARHPVVDVEDGAGATTRISIAISMPISSSMSEKPLCREDGRVRRACASLLSRPAPMRSRYGRAAPPVASSRSTSTTLKCTRRGSVSPFRGVSKFWSSAKSSKLYCCRVRCRFSTGMVG